MKSEHIYSIGSVAQITGLKSYVIRTWERRYRAIDPHRTSTNRRVYAQSDIEKLTLLKLAVERGHSISQIAQLSCSELSDLVKSTPVDRLPSIGADIEDDDPGSPETYRRQALQAANDLDPTKLEQTLASAVVHLSKSDFIHRVAVPLLVTIGDRWANGEMRITCEHLATVVVRSFLWDMLRGLELAENAPKIVLATPVGQWHEMGLMVVAVEAAECGWRPVYLGPDLPAEEIAYAAEHTGAKAVALYIAHNLDSGRLHKELEKLHRYLDADVRLFVGGSGGGSLKSVVDAIDALHVENARQFRKELDFLTNRPG